MTTVATALADARRRGAASLDAQLLLARLLATTRTRLIAHDERALTPAESARWQEWLERRLAGEPIAYLLGAAIPLRRPWSRNHPAARVRGSASRSRTWMVRRPRRAVPATPSSSPIARAG